VLAAGDGAAFLRIAPNSLFGIQQAGLLEAFSWGIGAELRPALLRDGPADRPFIVVRPSALGAELFLWGTGRGQSTIDSFFVSPKVEGLPEPHLDELSIAAPYHHVLAEAQTKVNR
jgi:hypothetical protein